MTRGAAAVASESRLTALYHEYLCRDPDPAAVANARAWRDVAESEARLRADLERCFEHRAVVAPLAAEVRRLYRFLHFREPAAAEVRHHVHQARGVSGSDAAVLAALDAGDVRAVLGVRPLNLELDVTNQCNLRCVMCYFSHPAVHRRPHAELPVETFARIADQVFPHCQRVSLSFATEALLHSRFEDLLAVARPHRVPKLYLNSNGLLLNEARIDRIAAAGLAAIGVSIDAATQATYERIRVGGRWERLLRNLELLRRVRERSPDQRPQLAVSFVLMRSNVDELPAFVELAHRFGAVGVNAIHMVPYDLLHNAQESLVHEPERCNRRLAEARARAMELGIALVAPEPFPAPGEPTTPREATVWARGFDLSAASAPAAPGCCRFPWHFVGMDFAGNVSPCGWWYGEPPLGNLREQTFAALWQGERWAALRAEHRDRRLRATCGSCPAAGMGATQDPRSFQSRSPVGAIP